MVYWQPIRTQWARKFKKVQAKKTREIKEINFTKKCFDQIQFFAISKMAKIQFLNWEKVENYQKYNFTKLFIYLFDFTSFLPGPF